MELTHSGSSPGQQEEVIRQLISKLQQCNCSDVESPQIAEIVRRAAAMNISRDQVLQVAQTISQLKINPSENTAATTDPANKVSDMNLHDLEAVRDDLSQIQIKPAGRQRSPSYDESYVGKNTIHCLVTLPCLWSCFLISYFFHFILAPKPIDERKLFAQ